QAERVRAGLASELAAAMTALDGRDGACESAALRVRVDRPRARYGAWYEMFPRSAGSDPTCPATFAQATARLPDVAAMGFDVLHFWAAHGVRILRVDNPHTKPFAFWEWLIAEVQAAYPDAIFLAEAFTRPKIMRRLAKCGFTQTYTYFTWRNTKTELIEYFTELTQTEVREYLRPNLFTNTPDVLHAFLHEGGRPAFQIRLVL